MNTILIRKLACSTVTLALVGLFGFVRAEDASHDEMVSTHAGTGTLNYFSTTACWINRTFGGAEKVVWKSADDYAVFPSTISTFLFQLNNDFSVYGLKNESSKTVAFTLFKTSVGAGGLQFTQAGGGFTFGYYMPMTILALTADQVWEGKNASGMSAVSVGYQHNFHKPYTDSRIVANAGVTDLTITGRLAALFYSPNNNLANVTVRVENGAELVLPDVTVSGTDAGSTWHTKGRLNAKCVVFSGEGIRARFGSVSPVVEGMKNVRPKTVDVIDVATLAPDVTLDAGADLVVSNVTFALDRISVTGGGTSTISGSALVFTNDVTEFAIDEGSRLALAALPKAGAETAAIAVTGAGTFELASGFTAGTLTGIDVASTATLAITGGEPLIIPITGSGTVLVNPGDGEEVFIDDLSGFSGTVEVMSGTLYLNSTPPCEVKTSGTGKVNLEGAKYIGNQPVVADEIKVSSGETLRVFGNGLTAATRVWMNGGTIEVLHDAVIGVSVTQDVTSVYRTGEGVTATFSGSICARTFGSAANHIAIYGGNVVFSGEVRAEGHCDCFTLYSGNVTLKDAIGVFGGSVTVPAGYAGKIMKFDGGTYEMRGTDGEQTLSAAVSGGQIVIANGARFEMKRNSNHVYFANYGVLDIDGGTLIVGYGRANFRDRSKLILRSGGLLESRPFFCISENETTFDWMGGTFKVSKDNSDKYIFAGYWNSTTVGGTLTVSGSDCVLDLSAVAAGSVFTCSKPSIGPVKWVGAAGAKLAVKGPGVIQFRDFTPNGMSLELGDRADVRYPTLKSGFALDELVVNGAECSISTESTTVTPSVSTLRIGANGVWKAGLLDAFGSPAWTDMIVDDGAILKFSPGDPVQTVPGTLTFGENARTWIERGSPTVQGVVMTATGGIVGAPAWSSYAGSKREVKVVGNEVKVFPTGLCLLVR